MSTFRIEKTSNYTVMSNFHFKERDMSLKAKGLLSLMLSLPDNWDYSIAGLVSICLENETAIKSTLKELRQFGYLSVTKYYPDQSDSGRIEYEYSIYEQPQKIQAIKKQGVEVLGVENHGQLNKEQSNTKTEIETKVSIAKTQKQLLPSETTKSRQLKKAADIKTIQAMTNAFSMDTNLLARLKIYQDMRIKKGLVPEQWKIILADLKQINGHSITEMREQVDNAIAGGYMQIVPSWEKSRKRNNKVFDNTSGREAPALANMNTSEKALFESSLAKDKEGRPMKF